jgi:hypothetical protein
MNCDLSQNTVSDLSHNILKEKKSVIARRMISEVTNALKNESPAVVMTKYVEYQKMFPKLFSVLLVPDYSSSLLEMLISQLELIENGQKSQHDASVSVGSVLVNKFVKPQVGLSNQ